MNLTYAGSKTSTQKSPGGLLKFISLKDFNFWSDWRFNDSSNQSLLHAEVQKYFGNLF